VCGGDAGLNDFIVRPEIGGFEDLRGKRLAVDAPNTAYALAAKKILKDRGLLEGRDYQVKLADGTGPRAAAMASDPELACGMINPPFNFKLRAQGLKSLGSQYDLLGPYQATGAYVVVRLPGGVWALIVDKIDRVIEIPEADITPVRSGDRDLVAEVARLQGELISLLSLEPLAQPA
jgi:hypothetical protein